jgi:predicted amidophosphoribosyltransferase
LKYPEKNGKIIILKVRMMSMGKKKLRCTNCGVVIKDDEKSCSVCHMAVERHEAEEEDSLELKPEFPVGKIVMGILIIIGVIFN